MPGWLGGGSFLSAAVADAAAVVSLVGIMAGLSVRVLTVAAWEARDGAEMWDRDCDVGAAAVGRGS